MERDRKTIEGPPAQLETPASDEESRGWREWRAFVDECTQALSRAARGSTIIFGGAYTRERFERNVHELIEARDYGAAATALGILCAMQEAGICELCDIAMVDGVCPACADAIEPPENQPR